MAAPRLEQAEARRRPMGKDEQAAGEPRGVQEEHLTEDLLARLLSSSTPEEYLREPGAIVDRSLASYVTDLLRSRGLKRADVVRASGLNGTFVYDIFAGKSKPGRDHAIMLAVGLGCNLRETQRLLRLAGVSELWPKVRRDAIIIWCIQHRYDRFQIDDELWHMDEQTLFHTGPLRGGRGA
jgi:hypothetical protein